ncbi:cell division protein FtsK, partial [Actinoplanes sp. NPDC051633]
WRFAGRCTTDASSDIVLGRGWAARGYSAVSVDPTNQGCGYLISESGTPALTKGAYLSNADIIRVADYAAWTRRTRKTTNQPTELRAVA